MTRSIRLRTAILAGASVSALLAGCGGGSQPGTGGSVDYVQYQTDAGSGSPPGVSFSLLWTFDPETMQLSPGDCTAAQGDETRLETDTAAWPDVLKQPMDSAEKNFRAAIAACSSGDFTTMTSDINQGKDGLAATRDAFGAHCKPTSDATKFAC